MIGRLFRLFVWLSSMLVVVAAIAAFIYRAELIRLYNVNTLFDENRIVSNFSSMSTMFHHKLVTRKADTVEWQVDPRDLATEYRFDGQAKSLQGWLDGTRTTSLLVIQDGKIVSENYYLGTGADDLRISWSMAKSFASAIFGIVMKDGAIKNLDDAVSDYVPTLKGTVYEGVRIRNVLNMASGVRFNEDYLDYDSDINRMGRILALGGSMDAFAAGLEAREREQGKLRQYTSIDTHILAMVLRQVTGKSLDQLFDELIWQKIGPQGDAIYLTDGEGVAFALGGLNMRTRDYARFGQMMLDLGRFNGQQVVPIPWAIESVKASAPVASNSSDHFGYGYQWWVPPGATEEFSAMGIYGQYMYVNRLSRTVIVKTSAHKGFRNDGEAGNRIKAETIATFRAIASGLSGWRNPEE
ncbi:MAG: serine hydrolase [Rhizobiaceae bacterium]